jgi:hypothetical protein
VLITPPVSEIPPKLAMPPELVAPSAVPLDVAPPVPVPLAPPISPSKRELPSGVVEPLCPGLEELHPGRSMPAPMAQKIDTKTRPARSGAVCSHAMRFSL